MPTSIPDLAWYVSTGLIVLLMTMIATLLGWGFTLLVKKLDHLAARMDRWIDEVTDVRSELREHKAMCRVRHEEAA